MSYTYMTRKVYGDNGTWLGLSIIGRSNPGTGGGNPCIGIQGVWLYVGYPRKIHKLVAI